MRGNLQRGSATLELSILAPALFALVFLIVQVALWGFGQQVAAAAAARAASTGAQYRGSPAAADERARAFVDTIASGLVRSVEVQSVLGAETIRVEVRGRSVSVLPGVPGLPIRAEAIAPLERFTG